MHKFLKIEYLHYNAIIPNQAYNVHEVSIKLNSKEWEATKLGTKKTQTFLIIYSNLYNFNEMKMNKICIYNFYRLIMFIKN